MLKEILKHPVALIIALALHLLVIMVFVISFSWSETLVVQEAGIPVKFIADIPPLATIEPKKIQIPIRQTTSKPTAQETPKPKTEPTPPSQTTKEIAQRLATQKAAELAK